MTSVCDKCMVKLYQERVFGESGEVRLMEFSVTSPIDGLHHSTHSYHSWSEVERMISRGTEAQRTWMEMPTTERLSILQKWVDIVSAKKVELAEELTCQMGRPCSEAPLEIDEFEKRSKRVLELTDQALARHDERRSGQLEHFVQPESLGVVLVQAGWNYPYIIAAHSVVPALAVGNAVLLRHSKQTPTCSSHLEETFRQAGGPADVLQAIRLPRQDVERLRRLKTIAQVAVTGALPSDAPRPGRRRHVGLGLDLGGKDPAYIRPDANIDDAAHQLMKAAFSNAGQSCCGVERIYVQESAFDDFVSAFKTQVQSLKLGNPREQDTTLGPMVRFQAATAVYDQVNATIKQGATPLLPNTPPDRASFHPQILIDVDHTMKLMSEETFGPAVGIMKVESDEEAIALMNDSRYALGASVWSKDVEAGLKIVRQVDTTTSYVNHCDYLDPAVAYLGVNGSPRGFTLSHFGFEMLTVDRSYWVTST